MDGVDYGLIIAEGHRKIDVAFLQQSFFNTLHQKADDVAGRDCIQTVVIAKIFSLDDGSHINIFAVGAKGPHVFIFRAFGKTALVFAFLYFGNFAAVDRASETGFVSDIVRFNSFFIDTGCPFKLTFLKISYRVQPDLIH